jgi:hypothetical protein
MTAARAAPVVALAAALAGAQTAAHAVIYMQRQFVIVRAT